jgi:hypothetical protein
MILAGVLLALPALASGAWGAPQKDGPYLINDLAAARAEARTSGKPLFVVFRCER